MLFSFSPMRFYIYPVGYCCMFFRFIYSFSVNNGFYKKINKILHVFLEILHRYCRRVILGTLREFYQIWDWWRNINNNLVFILDYFQEKPKTEFLEKKPRILFSQIKLSWKKGLCQFWNNPIIYHRAKNQRKLKTHSWEKYRTDGWITRQPNNGDFIGPSVGWKINKLSPTILDIIFWNFSAF